MKGIEAVIAKLKKLSAEVQAGIKDEIEDTTGNIEKDAVLNLKHVPHKPGELTYEASVAIGAGMIKSDFSHEGYVGHVHVDAGPMAAYIEFGTGQSAAQYVPTLPKEWQDMARTFYINGKGTIPATPYLYPAYHKHTAGLTDRIKKIIQGAAK